MLGNIQKICHSRLPPPPLHTHKGYKFWGELKAIKFKGKYEAELEFVVCGGGGGGGIDIFRNYTIFCILIQNDLRKL